MPNITLEIQHVASDEECAARSPRARMDELFYGAIVIAEAGLRLEPLPIVQAMSALSRAVHTLLFFRNEMFLSLDDSGTIIAMRRRDQFIEIDWNGCTHRFDIVSLSTGLGRAYRALLQEIAVRKPAIAGNNENFLTGDQELTEAWQA